MAPLALPPQPGKKAEEPKPQSLPATGIKIRDRKPSDKWISAEGVRFDLGGYQLYFVQVCMGDTGFSGFSLLAHPELFEKERLDPMFAEAAQVVLDTRIVPRRKAIATNQDPVANPKKLNEECFRADKDLFDSVMIDKFGFEQVQPAACRIVLEPTVKGVDHHA